ncbi:hypothetical protein F0344_05400 [Streptomyces finlayi]|uniref:Uncharacterized protein n=1 Tax=Streptomyces finlayi TaxID=67296 RepID=A0A7G7BFK0_9ACTN|nr:hypothetical protein [Streptomyces finlayi]QNE74115.1 hypothetical protein F0344_05400 [Streptomyces finlayi]
MPDYFDRLLVRYTPAGAADDARDPGTRVRVRPRSAGPFERAEALRHGPPEPDEPAALIPSAPAIAPDRPRSLRPDREVRTERHTVVRTEQVPAPGDARRPAPPAVPAPPPRSPAAPSPTARPDGTGRVRAVHRGRPSAPDDATSAPLLTAGPAPVAAPPARAAARPAPRDSAAAAARGAVLGSVGRRASRPAERVVHVQIGRLEVSAAPQPGANGSPAGRPAQRTGRPAPVLTLDDYLSRGGKRD